MSTEESPTIRCSNDDCGKYLSLIQYDVTVLLREDPGKKMRGATSAIRWARTRILGIDVLEKQYYVTIVNSSEKYNKYMFKLSLR